MVDAHAEGQDTWPAGQASPGPAYPSTWLLCSNWIHPPLASDPPPSRPPAAAAPGWGRPPPAPSVAPTEAAGFRRRWRRRRRPAPPRASPAAPAARPAAAPLHATWQFDKVGSSGGGRVKQGAARVLGAAQCPAFPAGGRCPAHLPSHTCCTHRRSSASTSSGVSGPVAPRNAPCRSASNTAAQSPPPAAAAPACSVCSKARAIYQPCTRDSVCLGSSAGVRDVTHTRNSPSQRTSEATT